MKKRSVHSKKIPYIKQKASHKRDSNIERVLCKNTHRKLWASEKQLITVFHEAKSTECEQTEPSDETKVCDTRMDGAKERNEAKKN